MQAGGEIELVFRVQIVDDPATPFVDESESYNFVSLGGDAYIVAGSVEVSIAVQDGYGIGGNVIFQETNNGGAWGPIEVPGPTVYSDIWIYLSFTASEDSTVGPCYIDFYQPEVSPVGSASWSSIKALYR